MRSELERAWARFFDEMGWPYEYEPHHFDTWEHQYGYTPDFEVWVKVGTRKSRNMLIEVKPEVQWPKAIERIQGAYLGEWTEIVLLGDSRKRCCVVELHRGTDNEELIGYPRETSSRVVPLEEMAL